MCEKCNVRDKWQIMNVTVKNDSKEAVSYVDAYYHHIVTVEPGETKHLCAKVTYS